MNALTSTAQAHESRPIYVELNERQVNTYQLQWKSPESLPRFDIPVISLPEPCEAQSHPVQFNGPDGSVQRVNYKCAESLSGRAITIRYPGPNPSLSSLIHYQTLNGERHTAILGPDKTSWTVPTVETASGVAKDYTLLGIGHIWGGIDHLLFVACLLWVAGTGSRILITITGFTIAHSITLILSALNVVRLPIPPVEASIALSVVFLATEIAKGRRHSLTWRYPIAISSSFGLLHGFGFAAALNEIGLPQTKLLTGLLFFNVGVEIGQIIFAASMLIIVFLFRKTIQRWFRDRYLLSASRLTMSYAAGTLASFWLVERCIGFL